MRVFLNVSIPLDAAPEALPHLVRFARWCQEPGNVGPVFAALYRRWALESEDPDALERLRTLQPDPEVRS